MLSDFSLYRKQVEDEIRQVKIPASAKIERDKALYVSSVFCALENYKEFGLFKAFGASSYTSVPVLPSSVIPIGPCSRCIRTTRT